MTKERKFSEIVDEAVDLSEKGFIARAVEKLGEALVLGKVLWGEDDKVAEVYMKLGTLLAFLDNPDFNSDHFEDAFKILLKIRQPEDVVNLCEEKGIFFRDKSLLKAANFFFSKQAEIKPTDAQTWFNQTLFYWCFLPAKLTLIIQGIVKD